MEYYSAWKGKKFDTSYNMDKLRILCSVQQRSHTWDKYFHLNEAPRVVKFQSRRQKAGCQGTAGRGDAISVPWKSFNSAWWKRVLWMSGADTTTALWMALMLQNLPNMASFTCVLPLLKI